MAGVYNPAAEADQAAIQAEADYYLRSFEEMFDATDLADAPEERRKGP